VEATGLAGMIPGDMGELNPVVLRHASLPHYPCLPRSLASDEVMGAVRGFYPAGAPGRLMAAAV
jgi:hypothetical protein